ncbi:hypothetical protein KBD49_10175 [Myxococcota bacterium]|jgi:hypothetical protein|nr:hypothetical protein [Myxococcota bacterium]
MRPGFLKRVPVPVRMAVSAALGILAGLAWYRFVGCRSGGCPLTSNPWLMALFGGAMGLSLGWPDAPARERTGPADGGSREGGDRDVL